MTTSTVERMRASSARRPLAALVGVLALLLVGTACGGETRSAPEPSPTPIARLNTTSMQVPRIAFCRLVDQDAVATALGGAAASDTSYGNGDEEALAGVGRDVVHELGCTWTGKADPAGVTVARAWVFARPVESGFARTVIASGSRTPGCRAVSGPTYGSPTTTQVCTRVPGAPAGTQRVRHAGLFGQTWLTCELQGPGDLRDRADTWCVEVANALNTAR